MPKKKGLDNLEHLFEEEGAGSTPADFGNDPSMALDDEMPFESLIGEDADDDEHSNDDENDNEAETAGMGEDFPPPDKDPDDDDNVPPGDDDDADPDNDGDVDNINVADFAQDVADDLAGAIVDAFNMLKDGQFDDGAGDPDDAPPMPPPGDPNDQNDQEDGPVPPTEDMPDPSDDQLGGDPDDNPLTSKEDGVKDQMDAIDSQIADLQAKKAQLAASKQHEGAGSALDWENGGSEEDPDECSSYQAFANKKGYNEGEPDYGTTDTPIEDGQPGYDLNHGDNDTGDEDD